MPTIRIDRFQGLAPRFDRRQIPVGAAQIARNIRFDAGDLKPFQKPLDPALPVLGATGANIGNLAYYRNGDDRRLIAFGDAMHVTSTRSPVPNDAFERFYWHVHGGSGEQGLFAIGFNEDPPYPNGAATGSGSEYRQYGGYRVGVPAPKEAPVASATDADLASVSGTGPGSPPAPGDPAATILTIAATNPIQINLDDEAPFEVGQRVRFSVDPDHPKPGEDDGGGVGPPPEDPDDPPAGDGQIWALDGLEGVVSSVGATDFKVTGVSASGFGEFTEADIAALTITRFITDADLESRAYVFTYVNEFGEEGPPSPPSNIIDLGKEGVARVEVSDLIYDESDGGSRDYVNRIRLYRTVAGESATLYVLVGTLPFDGGASDDSDASWVDEPSAVANLAWTGLINDPVGSVALGEPIPSEGWYPPPTGMLGISMMANGIMAGWKGNTVHFSEPYLPHAWDPDNSLTLSDDVVGAESFGNTLVCGTSGRPYFISGVDPASMRDQKAPHHAPLIAPRAIADAGTGVIYTSDTGLIWAGAGGIQVLTKKWTKETWGPAVADLDRITFFDGYAILFAPGQDPLIMSMVGDEAEAAYLDLDFSCAVRRESSLAFVIEQPVTGNPYRLVRYFNEETTVDGDPDRMTAAFRSGLVTFHRPVNAGVAQVLADGYPLTLTVRSIDPPTYPAPVAGQPDLQDFQQQEYTVLGPEPFRLAGGYLSREYEIDIESSHRVQRVVLTTDMGELRAQPS